LPVPSPTLSAWMRISPSGPFTWKERRLTSLMHAEALEAPARIAELLASDPEPYETLARRLRDQRPRFAMTIARGSSDNAAAFCAYLIASRAGVVTASLPPSLETLSHAELD